MPSATSQEHEALSPQARRIAKVLGNVNPFAVAEVIKNECDVRVLHERPVEYGIGEDSWFPMMDSIKAGEEPRQTWASKKGIAEMRDAPHEAARFRFGPCGGKTEVFLTLPDGTYAMGRAVCSEKDTFARRAGREVALARALARLELILTARDQGEFAVGGHFEDDEAAHETELEARASLVAVQNMLVAAERRLKGPIAINRARKLMRRPEAAQALFDHLAPYFKKKSGPADATVYDALMAATEVAVEAEGKEAEAGVE
jgi:hypothetical protein